MDNNFKTVVEQINRKNGKQLFEMAKIGDVDRFINHLPKMEYVGHGVQSICFKTNKGYVIKCCMKRPPSIITSKTLFTLKTHELLNKNMPILPLIDVLYEDDIWMVYTQPMCRIIDNVNTRFCYIIVKFIRQMIENNIRISDIYYRNFGVYQNKILMFDYHNIDTFESPSNFLITNLYSLFKLLGQTLGWNIHDTNIVHWDDIIANNFGQKCFPRIVVDLLRSLHGKDTETIVDCIDKTLIFLRKYIKQTSDLYQNLVSECDGVIRLVYPCRVYEFIFAFIQSNNITNILDAHSVDTGIGLKLAQDFPNLSVTLGCSTNEEVLETRTVINDCLTYNTSIIYANVLDIRPVIGEKYDLVLYYSTFYNLLQTNKLGDILRIIKSQVGQYCIIEVPVIGDTSLTKIMDRHKNINYECLTTPYMFRSYLCVNNIKVNRCLYVDYDNHELKRYLFVCSISTNDYNNK